VRIGVVSDIHCNYEALSNALAEMDGVVDEVFVAGDVIYEYRFSHEVVSTIADRGFPAVQGNHEMVFLSPRGEARARSNADPRYLRYLGNLPTRLDSEIGGRLVTMVHGSPWERFGDYLSESDRRWDRSVELGADVILTGHTHIPMVKRVGGVVIVNPGSLGESREVGKRDLVSYAVVDLDDLEVEIHRIPNPRLAG
jgi:putative phosphoesterase